MDAKRSTHHARAACLDVWHIMGTEIDSDGKRVKMPCRDVPVMAILKEFRAMAFEGGGTHGRKAHPPAEVAKSTSTRSIAPLSRRPLSEMSEMLADE